MSSHPHIRRGQAVALRARKGCSTATYAKVIRFASPSAVQVIITADSGGRRRGDTYTAPLGCVSPRPRGQHRRPAPRRPSIWRWWGR